MSLYNLSFSAISIDLIKYHNNINENFFFFTKSHKYKIILNLKNKIVSILLDSFLFLYHQLTDRIIYFYPFFFLFGIISLVREERIKVLVDQLISFSFTSSAVNHI